MGCGQQVLLSYGSSLSYLIYDDFHRANSGTLGTAPIGGNWSLAGAGTFSISSNVALFTRSALNTTRVWLNPGAANGTVETTFGTVKTGSGLWVRSDNSGNSGYIFGPSSGLNAYECYLMTGGGSSFTLQFTHAATVSNGDVIRVVLSGNNITGYANGVQMGTVSNNTNNSETHHGFWGGNAAGDDGATYTLITMV